MLLQSKCCVCRAHFIYQPFLLGYAEKPGIQMKPMLRFVVDVGRYLSVSHRLALMTSCVRHLPLANTKNEPLRRALEIF